MVRAVKQMVTVQPGGRVEIVSPDLPDGQVAEVIVLLAEHSSVSQDCWGLFSDETEMMDQIVTEAMMTREHI